MPRIARAALPAVAALAFGLAPQAHATTVPGCFGATPVIYCDPTVTVSNPYGVGTTGTTYTVCAGACQDVTVPVPGLTSTGQPLDACATVTPRGGTPFTTCVVQAAGGAIDTVIGVTDIVAGRVNDEIDRVCGIPANTAC